MKRVFIQNKDLSYRGSKTKVKPGDIVVLKNRDKSRDIFELKDGSGISGSCVRCAFNVGGCPVVLRQGLFGSYSEGICGSIQDRYYLVRIDLDNI